MAVTVGIDVGTTSVKAVAADDDGTVVARARIPHAVSTPAPDRLEHDAQRAWRWGPRRALAGLGRLTPAPAAISVVAMVPSLTAVNQRGTPQAPGLLYGDERGRDGGDGGEVAGFARWLVETCPDARGYWPAQALANHALAGEAVMDMTAVGATMGLFDGRIPTEKLPRTAGIGEAVGKVGEVVLDAGGVDAVGEQLVAGVSAPGDVLVMLGTTLIVWVGIPQWAEVDGFQTIPHLAAPGCQLAGGPSNAGGLFLDWVTKLVGTRGAPPFDPRHVPVWAPYPRGERAPLDDPDRRAELRGLDLTHGPAAIRRAAYESSGFVVRRMLERIGTATGVSLNRVVVTGGGVHHVEWLQAIADAVGRALHVVAVPEGAALGAAWLARMAAGLESSLEDAARWARTDRVIDPDQRWVDPVAERYLRFRAIGD